MWDLGWPTEEDLRTAASAIVRIQHVYDFNTTEVKSLFNYLVHIMFYYVPGKQI